MPKRFRPEEPIAIDNRKNMENATPPIPLILELANISSKDGSLNNGILKFLESGRIELTFTNSQTPSSGPVKHPGKKFFLNNEYEIILYSPVQSTRRSSIYQITFETHKCKFSLRDKKQTMPTKRIVLLNLAVNKNLFSPLNGDFIENCLDNISPGSKLVATTSPILSTCHSYIEANYSIGRDIRKVDQKTEFCVYLLMFFNKTRIATPYEYLLDSNDNYEIQWNCWSQNPRNSQSNFSGIVPQDLMLSLGKSELILQYFDAKHLIDYYLHLNNSNVREVKVIVASVILEAIKSNWADNVKRLKKDSGGFYRKNIRPKKRTVSKIPFLNSICLCFATKPPYEPSERYSFKELIHMLVKDMNINISDEQINQLVDCRNSLFHTGKIHKRHANSTRIGIEWDEIIERIIKKILIADNIKHM